MNTKDFKSKIWRFYKNKKRILPWRKTRDSYKILVSEIMLQQTQVSRVLPKYNEFIERFPTLESLAKASPKSVLAAWSGLGYNRRALYLHNTAKILTEKFGGRVPQSKEALSTLPGVGKNTAGAIYSFSFNKPSVFIETNIRSVFLHEWFPKRKIVSDKEIFPLIEKTLPKKDFRAWYYALMDYGAYLKKSFPNPSQRSAHHTKQTPFKKSNRYARGVIVKTLLSEKSLSKEALCKKTSLEKKVIEKNLAALQEEGFLVRKEKEFSLR
jgi:A/G-specific adenine glycosylase